MAVAVFLVHEVVVVAEVAVACIVGWVYVDEVDFAAVCVIEHREGMVVVAFDEQVGGLRPVRRIEKVGGGRGVVDAAIFYFVEDGHFGFAAAHHVFTVAGVVPVEAVFAFFECFGLLFFKNAALLFGGEVEKLFEGEVFVHVD